MYARFTTAMAGLLLVVAAAAAEQPAAPVHDKDWWRAVVADDFAQPPDTSLPALVIELNGYLGSPDPELRDEIAYGVLTHWLYRQRTIPPALRQSLVDGWRANLRRGIGERGTDTVLLRSFSALMLSVAVALDNEAPYLDAAAFRRLLDAALIYLRDERDTRGFEPDRGWIHSVAHTADLLRFLGRSRYLETADQAAILAAIGAKLDAVGQVLAYGEDERLARAVLSILARSDADMEAVGAFLDSLEPERFETTTPAGLAANQNRKHLAVSLYALLAVDERDAASLTAARERLEGVLRAMM